jgi:hypothetical protein
MAILDNIDAIGLSFVDLGPLRLYIAVILLTDVGWIKNRRFQ